MPSAARPAIAAPVALAAGTLLGGANACGRSSLDVGGVPPSLDATALDAPADDASVMDAPPMDAHATEAARVDAPASCGPGGDGLTNCGAGAESCCASLEVTGGTFYRTYSYPAPGVDAGDADPATLTAFRLDKYDVTVGRFRQFVRAWNGGAGWTPGAGSGKHAHLDGGNGLANSASAGTYEPGWVAGDEGNIALTDGSLACDLYATWTPSAGSNETRPINCVNWWEAYAFCIWDGGFLPSEAERVYAAAGGAEQRKYPWGSTEPGQQPNQYAIFACNYPQGGAPGGVGTCLDSGNIAPVGTPTLGAGRWGQLDLLGNVYEWDLDWNAPYVNPCTDCAYVTHGGYRALGGSVFDNLLDVFTSGPPHTHLDRSFEVPMFRYGTIGFRCARSP